MATELPRNLIGKDPSIRVLHREGYYSYTSSRRSATISIHPNPKKNFWFEISADVKNVDVPLTAKINWYFRKNNLSEVEAGEKIEKLDNRVTAWIAGFGLAAFRHKDYKTALAALEIVAKNEIEANQVFNWVIQKVVVGFLGLPKE